MMRLYDAVWKARRWLPPGVTLNLRSRRGFRHLAARAHEARTCSRTRKREYPRGFDERRPYLCVGRFKAVDREFRWIAGQRSGRSASRRHPCCILNRMAQYSQTHFDASFGALSDATRRGVLEQLGRADASITALAERFHMTLTGMKKHVGVLEQAGLVSTEKVGRVRTCKLGLRGLEEEAAWIERHRQLWAARFDELDIVVEELKRKEKANGRNKRK